MSAILTFKRGYFGIAIFIFLIEVGIARYIHDNFIRPYFGDTLVVVLIYCFVKSFLDLPIVATAIGVLFFAYGIEMLQYYNFVMLMGLEKSKIANVVLGNSFEWIDFAAYTAGIALVLLAEKRRAHRNAN